MKKLIAFVSVLVCVLALAGCNNTKDEQVLKYSFSGENEYFKVSNGSIILSNTEEVFNGGDLETTLSTVFDDVVSYTGTFYTLINDNRRIILSNSTSDKAGGTVNVDGDLGSVSGKDVIIGKKASTVNELKENLWFELKTSDLNGRTNTYQLQLTLTEIAGTPTE